MRSICNRPTRYATRCRFEVEVIGPGGWRHSEIGSHRQVSTVKLPIIGPHFFKIYMCSRLPNDATCSQSPPDSFDVYAERAVVLDRVPMWWLENGMYATDPSHEDFKDCVHEELVAGA